MTATVWKPNGEKCPDTNLVGGTGITCRYHNNGSKKEAGTYKEDEQISLKEWDRDGNQTHPKP